jgi:hypothetical protein
LVCLIRLALVAIVGDECQSIVDHPRR